MTDLKLSAETTHNNPASTSGALRLDSTNMDGTPASGYTEFDDIAALLMVPGQLYGGYIQPSDTGSGLKLEVLTDAGATPSATAPVRVKINRTVRKITGACTFTLADGTNWMNAGSAETATKEIDYFAYVVWDSADSVVALSASRIPFGGTVSNFNSTNTNDKYLINYANFATTDDVEICGRFAATLSAGAGYTWSVPTYDNSNLIQHPISETRPLEWVPVQTGFSTPTTGGIYRYIVMGRRFQLTVREQNTGGTSNSTTFTMTGPLTCRTIPSMIWDFPCSVDDNGVPLAAFGTMRLSSGSNIITFYKDAALGAFAASGTKRCRSGFIQGEL